MDRRGCVPSGKYFEGTATSMQRIAQTVRQLPPATLIWPGHEYTVSNLRFAATIEPDNAATADALTAARTQQLQRRATVPSTVAAELETNPFLRCHLPSVTERVLGGTGDNDADHEERALLALRAAKDAFRPPQEV